MFGLGKSITSLSIIDYINADFLLIEAEIIRKSQDYSL